MSTPPPLVWEKVTPKTSFRPPRRSGHTITSVDEFLFLFGGCIYDDGFERSESKARTSKRWYLIIIQQYRLQYKKTQNHSIVIGKNQRTFF